MELRPVAKINITLKVKGLREDGYHYIESLCLPVDLKDDLSVETINDNKDVLEVNDSSLADPAHNLVTKAFAAFRKEFGLNTYFRAVLQKRIPTEAGLGGGSSDCAYALKAAAKLCSIEDENRLRKVALTLGADVPYFLNPKPAIITGIGEFKTEIAGILPYKVLIAKPVQGLSTKEVYQTSDGLKKTKINSGKVISALKRRDLELAGFYAGNDLELAAETLLPEVKRLINNMKGLGFAFVQMTGSGTSVFAIDEDEERLEAGRRKLREDGYMAFITSTLN